LGRPKGVRLLPNRRRCALRWLEVPQSHRRGLSSLSDARWDRNTDRLQRVFIVERHRSAGRIPGRHRPSRRRFNSSGASCVGVEDGTCGKATGLHHRTLLMALTGIGAANASLGGTCWATQSRNVPTCSCPSEIGKKPLGRRGLFVDHGAARVDLGPGFRKEAPSIAAETRQPTPGDGRRVGKMECRERKFARNGDEDGSRRKGAPGPK